MEKQKNIYKYPSKGQFQTWDKLGYKFHIIYKNVWSHFVGFLTWIYLFSFTPIGAIVKWAVFHVARAISWIVKLDVNTNMEPRNNK